ncbi:hypothetical protein B0H63DRAFT_153182 [Podospora didyma]|uniref:Uncharacterized protein n=1 Tax=Podospora didyma TaxID=330526 RepID=A0AAE0U1B7_9PEZI|nr:hypothetical protein B0H63DRAFT_153182 [Podospora didyma]
MANSNLNAGELWSFLRDYDESYASGRHRHYSGDRNVRWSRATTYDLDTLSDLSNESFEPRRQPTHKSTALSTTSRGSTRRSNAPSTVFSRHSRGAQSSVGKTTAPPRSVALGRNLVQQIAAGPAGGQDDFILWCEFCELKNCAQTFRGDDEAGWIAHHADHMGDNFPEQLMCWFCDHVPFVADRPTERRANFDLRMQHIRAHVFDEYQAAQQMRPDFFVVEHLHKHGRLDEDTFMHAMGYNELPEALRLPDSDPEPPSLFRDQVQFHDLERERRQDRRRNRGQNGRMA